MRARQTYRVADLSVSVVVGGVAYRPGETFVADPRDRRVARWVRAGMVVRVDQPAEPAKPAARRKRTRAKPAEPAEPAEPAPPAAEPTGPRDHPILSRMMRPFPGAEAETE